MAVINRNKNVNATLVQAQTGSTNLKGVTVVNSSAATCFVQMFNALAANVTLGTTVPDYQIQVAANSTFSSNEPPEGLIFPTGLVIASTTTDGGLTGSAAGVEVYLKV
jgi:hypothetical protein